jgi:protein-tyrosine phosphatase
MWCTVDPSGNGSGRVPGHLLVVCVGNVCRSPMAECLLRDRLGEPATIVGSAGLAALAGQPIDPCAESVLGAHGLSAGPHVARQLEESMIDAADLVLVMEKAQILSVHMLAPGAVGKTFLLGKWLGAVDIPDPFRRRREHFEHVYRMIELAVESWCTRFHCSEDAQRDGFPSRAT